MVRDVWQQLMGVAPEKRIVASALSAGIVFLAARLVEGSTFYSAFTQAALVAFLLMVVLTTARSIWRGEELEEAEAGGWRMRFSVARRAVGAQERRLDAHIRATDERLLDLEREVFKNEKTG